MLSTASSPHSPAGTTREVVRDDLASRTMRDNGALSDQTMRPFTNFDAEEPAKQLNSTRIQSPNGRNGNSHIVHNGNDLASQFDFNLSMLSTADDSHNFGFLPDNPDRWPALTYGVHGGNVYSKLEARPAVDHRLLHMLILSLGNYNADVLPMVPASYPVDYSHVNPADPWSTPPQSNDRSFHMSTTQRHAHGP